MADSYQHPVFFECRGLQEKQLKRIENYFRARRRSGGGECGPLRTVKETVYCVAFKHQRDRQNVLQRSKHVVDGLVLTVRGSVDPPTSTSTASQDFTRQVQSMPAATALPSGEEYERPLESYLLQYLEECPKVEKELQEQLASVASSAQFFPDEEWVIVRSLAQLGSVDEVGQWKAEVDQLFDSYLCHYEVDPHKIKALLQSCSSSPQSTDEVKVYSELGMAVVVGKRSQVNAKLKDLEDLQVKCEKKTRICSLGKAKLCLLWRDIEHCVGRNFPGVEVTQGDEGQIVLEGSVEEILKAGELISYLENLVLERSISYMSPRLLAFLKKAYGCPAVLGDFLRVGGKVQVELRDTELRLFTFCADKLDEMETTLQREIKEVKIIVPNCSAVPPELQEQLKFMTNEMNQGQYRTQVVFDSDSTVTLLGHVNEVEELSETVTRFILDKCSFQSILHFPSLELAQELPEFLQLRGVDYSGVSFHPFTSSSGPALVPEGPSSKVTQVRNKLGTFLDSFPEDRVTTEPLGAVKYVQGPTGKHKLLNVTQNLASLSLIEANTTVASYSLCDGLQVLVCDGDITKLDADALVNAANEDLDHGGGVAAALSKAGGPEVQKESRALVKQIGKIPTGEVVVTTGGNLYCKILLHAVGPVGGKSGGRERALLEETVRSALNLAEMFELESIAMPCISSGVFGVPVTVCSEAIVTAIKKFGCEGGRSLRRIILIDNKGEIVRAMQEACDWLLYGMNTRNSSPNDSEFQIDASAQDNTRGATAEVPGDGVHLQVIQGTIETQQVDAVVSPMVGHDPVSTRIGNTLYEMVGQQLTERFTEEAGGETMPGDAILVEGLKGLPSKAVFFLNLSPWDDDQEGGAVQVLRMSINTILTSCEERGFGSVALPVLGAGIALRFPVSVVAKVLLEEVHKFEQNRNSRTPMLINIVIHPNDEKSCEVFKSAQEAFQLSGFTKDVHQPDGVSTPKRIVLLGKTGSGKSNLANTIFGEKLFTTNHTPNSGTRACQAETKSVNGRSITLIDTPGCFDTREDEEDLKPEIVSCITECSPGPHAFLIVLKVDKFTEHEQAVITKICQYFSKDALKYAVIVFTHGDQLPKGMKIEDFVCQNKKLSDLVESCGGRCHVIDNKYWNIKVQNNYRSNQFQVEELLQTVDNMVMENNGGYYVNQVFEAVEKEIQKEEVHIRQSAENMSMEEVRKQAKSTVSNRFLISLAGTTTGVLLGAFCGVRAMVGLVITALKNSTSPMNFLEKVPALGGAATAAVAAGGGKVVVVTAGAAVGVTLAAAGGGVWGGIIGRDAAKRAETLSEAVDMAANAVVNKEKQLVK